MAGLWWDQGKPWSDTYTTRLPRPVNYGKVSSEHTSLSAYTACAEKQHSSSCASTTKNSCRTLFGASVQGRRAWEFSSWIDVWRIAAVRLSFAVSGPVCQMLIRELCVCVTFHSSTILSTGEMKLHGQCGKNTAFAHVPSSDTSAYLALSMACTTKAFPAFLF
ncbi:hypothetical protein TNCV_4233311 [Trichonephila clavipes]|nr:hypothetical protein TNCV_4233311 [Trichonephila clavipes]